MSNQQNEGSPFASVLIHEYRYLLSGRFFFIVALRMMSTLVGWWVYQLTNAPFAIGVVGLSEFIPAFSLALYAGHVIDISEKRWMLLRGVLLYLLCALTLLFLSTSVTKDYFSKHWIAISIYGVIFCTGVIRAFTGPVFNVILAHIVPKNILQNATTWNQGTWLSASVSGHALSGFLIAYVGITGTLVTICSFMVVAFIFLFRLKRKAAFNDPRDQKIWESVKAGLHFVFKTKE